MTHAEPLRPRLIDTSVAGCQLEGRYRPPHNGRRLTKNTAAYVGWESDWGGQRSAEVTRGQQRSAEVTAFKVEKKGKHITLKYIEIKIRNEMHKK